MVITRAGKEYIVGEGYEWFWNMFANETWEPETFKIFDRFLEKDRNFLDIGAWIGPTALYAADKAKQVFAFEPDMVAYEKLTQNLDLNRVKNVVPYPVAVSDEWKPLNFGPKTGFGDSMSSELWSTKELDFQVPAVAFRSLIRSLQPNFIKIDIEGGEKFIFENSSATLRDLKPTIHLSLHTPWHQEDLGSFTRAITEGLSMYPLIYNQNLERISLQDAFDVNAFNSIVATFIPI